MQEHYTALAEAAHELAQRAWAAAGVRPHADLWEAVHCTTVLVAAADVAAAAAALEEVERAPWLERVSEVARWAAGMESVWNAREAKGWED